MRISSKGRYGLAAMIKMAQNPDAGECTTIISISEKLGISKIYLEQVFSLLKRAGLVISIKGAYGGYKLSRRPERITVFEILTAVEQSLFEAAEESVTEHAEEIEKVMQNSVFSLMDSAVKDALKAVTLLDLALETEQYKKVDGFMFYI